MDLDTYYRLISSEKAARKYLSRKCRKNGHRFCPRCTQRKLYKLADERYRCSLCDYTFHDFSGRWINYGRLSALQWLSLIKLFELEVSVRKMSLQLGLSYRAVYWAVSTIRMAILSHALEGFWSWAKERLMKHHGVSKDRFPLYLKELEFRYNHRTADLFDEVANYLCDLVPKRD